MNPYNVSLTPYSDRFTYVSGQPKKQAAALVFVLGEADKKSAQPFIRKYAPLWQKSQLLKSDKDVLHFASKNGPVWILTQKPIKHNLPHEGRLEEAPYAWHRDQLGQILIAVKNLKVGKLAIHFQNTSEEIEVGSLVGLNLAAYNYRETIKNTKYKDLPKVVVSKVKGVPKGIIEAAAATSLAVNGARHLTNIPANYSNPPAIADFVKNYFKSSKTTTVTVWDENRLKKENCGLILGTGGGAATPPRLVRISYRPKQSSEHRPVAFVGKGITFDSGGLDIKPSAGMRLMKKDMACAAAAFGIAAWAEEIAYPHPLDCYMPLAENAIDANSMRPGDVLTARNGLEVEIHNTDAEGRLVLADALDVAVTQEGKDACEIVINMGTLTGACRVALGQDIGGLFSNRDDLAEDINRAGFRTGDLNWRMPLFQKYTSNFSTSFGDIVNTVDSGGGAITAALFLEKFVKDRPWAHLDIYSWNDRPSGAISQSGANGQSVQCLIEFLRTR